VPVAAVLAPAVPVADAADPPCGLDDPLDEHAATASATPASGTAQRSLLGMERTALLCSVCFRLPIVDYRPLGWWRAYTPVHICVDSLLFTNC
jgi:hypothetical protein